jgi:hypothetical protein
MTSRRRRRTPCLSFSRIWKTLTNAKIWTLAWSSSPVEFVISLRFVSASRQLNFSFLRRIVCVRAPTFGLLLSWAVPLIALCFARCDSFLSPCSKRKSTMTTTTMNAHFSWRTLLFHFLSPSHFFFVGRRTRRHFGIVLCGRVIINLQKVLLFDARGSSAALPMRRRRSHKTSSPSVSNANKNDNGHEYDKKKCNDDDSRDNVVRDEWNTGARSAHISR